MSPKIMKRGGWIALAVFVGVVAGAERWARGALPKVPPSEQVARNPYRFRGWPEYTQLEPARAQSARVVLISNSQAYAGEMPANRIYADKLERALNAARAGGFEHTDVLNWSFDGVTSIELTLLAARLGAASPELVIAAVGVADFSAYNLDRRLSGVRTDLPRLIAHPEVWRALPPAFKKRHVNVEDGLTYIASDRIALLRFREYVWSWLDQRWSGLQMGLYAPAINYHPWRLERVQRRASLGSPPWRTRSPLQVSYASEARELIAEFLDVFQAIPARQHLVILTPRFLEEWDPLLAMDIAFRRDLSDLLAARGLLFWDDSQLFGREAFFDGLHFKPDYHQRYCDRLMQGLPALLETAHAR